MTTERSAGAREIQLNGRPVQLRDMKTDDAEALLTFVRSVPRHDLMFLPTDITEIEGVNGWIHDVLLGVTRVILATDADRVLGFSSVVRAPTPWMRHIAELRIVVDEAARHSGLSHELIAEAFRVAATSGVARITAQMTLDQQGAMRLFRDLGFSPLAVLPEQVMDQDGTSYDLLVMHQDVEAFESTLSRLGD